MIMFLSVAVL